MDKDKALQFLEDLQEFVDSEIRPNASKFDSNKEIPQSVLNKITEKRYHVASLPNEYGGLGLDPVTFGYLLELFGKASFSAANLIAVTSSLVGETIVKWGSNEQKQRIITDLAEKGKIAAFALSEPDIGSDARSIKTTYKQVDDYYVLNGKKKWITFGAKADYYCVLASDGEKVSAFIVNKDDEGLSYKHMNNLMAANASYLAEIELNDVKVKKENLLGAEGTGFSCITNTALDNGRFCVAWTGIGLAQDAFDRMINYSVKRTQFGSKLYKNQSIKEIIAISAVELKASRELGLRASVSRKSGSNNRISDAIIAKYHSSKIAMEIATKAVQMHGANGLDPQFGVERLFREAKILEIIEGTTQVLNPIIAIQSIQDFRSNNNIKWELCL